VLVPVVLLEIRGLPVGRLAEVEEVSEVSLSPLLVV
jgi:hypothetical protein